MYTVSALRLGEWAYVAFVYNNTTGVLEVYFNGQLERRIYRTPGDIETVAGGLTITEPGWRAFNGTIDEVRISNIARTAEEIRAHWGEPVAVAEPNLDAENNLILDGSKSFDTDGNILFFDWGLVNRDPDDRNFTLSGELVATDSVDIGVYDVTLFVTDNDGLTDMDTMVLAVPVTIQNLVSIIEEPSERGEVIREIIREIVGPRGR